MPEQFLREVRVQVGDAAERLTVEDLLIRFRVQKYANGTPAEGEIDIYNLADASETRVQERGKAVVLFAGYDGRLEEVFRGDVRRVERFREKYDRITRIHVGGAVQNRTVAIFRRAYEGETAVRTIVQDAVAELGLDIGPLTLIPADATKTNFRYNGGSISLLLDRLLEPYGVSWYEEDGTVRFTRLQASADDRPDGVTISENTGLIGTPTRTDDGIRFKTLLDHRLKLDTVVTVQAFAAVLRAGSGGGGTNERAAELEGARWKVVEVVHGGDNREGEFYTQVEGRPVQ